MKIVVKLAGEKVGLGGVGGYKVPSDSIRRPEAHTGRGQRSSTTTTPPLISRPAHQQAQGTVGKFNNNYLIHFHDIKN